MASKTTTLKINGEAVILSASMYRAMMLLELSDIQPTRRTGDALSRRGVAEWSPVTYRWSLTPGAKRAYGRMCS